jgi:transposase
MVITRKIEIFICEEDKALRKEYYKRLYKTRDIAVKVANMTSSHLFMLDNTTPYLSDEDREKLTFLGVKGQKATKQNAPYVVASNLFKGEVSMTMVASLQQEVYKAYQADMKKGMWDRSLRSYKANIPVPYQPKAFVGLRFAEYEDKKGKKHEGCFFSVDGVPFQMRFGRDRSGNRLIVERAIKDEYKMCTSSVKYDTKKHKWYLLLCVDVPKKEAKVDPKKVMYAYLGVMNPIICTCDVRAAKDYDSGYKWFEIGTKEEFNYRRRQIQEAVHRCQINNRYASGGKGRKRKTQALDRWENKERNYVDTKLHLYSRALVDLAVKHGCGEIRLIEQKPREDEAKEENKKGNPFVLRNWSYYGLKEKIAYKGKMVGVKLTQDIHYIQE